jgi:heme-degrading monooxygenase HmoA
MDTNADQKEIYTLGIWSVKSGDEPEFIRAWTEFAHWTSEHIEGCGKGYLLQDETNASRFISYGPWADENAIQKWRDSQEFKDFVSKVRILCDDFQPNTLKLVATSE